MPPAAPQSGSSGPKRRSCRVPGCDESLEPGYSESYRICRRHSRAECFELDGRVVRYCQQCGKIHGLEDFDPGRASCRMSLARHQAARLARQARGDGGSKRGPRRSTAARASQQASGQAGVRKRSAESALGPAPSGQRRALPPPQLQPAAPSALSSPFSGAALQPATPCSQLQLGAAAPPTLAARPCSPAQRPVPELVQRALDQLEVPLHKAERWDLLTVEELLHFDDGARRAPEPAPLEPAATATSACCPAPAATATSAACGRGTPPLVAELQAYAAAQLHSQASVHTCPSPPSSQLRDLPAAPSHLQAQLQAARAAAAARQQAADAVARLQAVQAQAAAAAASKQPWLAPAGAEPFLPEIPATWGRPERSALDAASTAAAAAAAVRPLASAPVRAAPASASLLAGLVPLQAPLQLGSPPPAVLTPGRNSPLGHGPSTSTYVVPCVDASGCTGNLIILLPGAAAVGV